MIGIQTMKWPGGKVFKLKLPPTPVYTFTKNQLRNMMGRLRTSPGDKVDYVQFYNIGGADDMKDCTARIDYGDLSVAEADAINAYMLDEKINYYDCEVGTEIHGKLLFRLHYLVTPEVATIIKLKFNI